MVSPRLTVRSGDPAACRALEAAGIHPLLARLWAARGVVHPDQTRLAWPAMLPPTHLTRADHAAAILAAQMNFTLPGTFARCRDAPIGARLRSACNKVPHPHAHQLGVGESQ